MITMDELLKGKSYDSQSKEVRTNLSVLLYRINLLRTAYDKSMIVTSGLRTKEDQIRIYAEKGVMDMSKIPMGSSHLTGGAVDISDPQQELQKYVKNNLEFVADIGLWFEDFKYSKNWVHAQVIAPASGRRFFIP